MSTRCNRSGMVAWAVHARFANTMMYIVHSHIVLRDALLRGSLDLLACPTCVGATGSGGNGAAVVPPPLASYL
jgi:hypothetical protein